MSVPLAVSLAELRTPLEQSYRNTVYCTANLEQAGGTLAGRYCGNRWCLVCNRIRTARAITQYLPELKRWKQKHMVTLTVRNVPAAELRATVADMVKTFQRIKLAMRRTDGVSLVALRKLEATYNRRRDDYHPHFHVIVPTRAMGRLLVTRWLEAFPMTTDAAAQDVRACDDGTMHEVFKYFTKLLTKTRGNTDAGGRSAPVPPAALDVIFRAMKGRRVYQPVGFTVASSDDADAERLEPVTATAALSRPTETILWTWQQPAADWVDGRTGECLTGYEPGERFARFVASIGTRHDVDEPAAWRPDAAGELAEVDQVREIQRRIYAYAYERRHAPPDATPGAAAQSIAGNGAAPVIPVSAPIAPPAEPPPHVTPPPFPPPPALELSLFG